MIAFKQIIRIGDQWRALHRMTELVRHGSVTFPRQVVNELSAGQHPDAPGAWIAGVPHSMHPHPQPTEATLARVLAGSPLLVDVEATNDREVADPYVAAMAYEIHLAHSGCEVIVATNDFVDRPPIKTSLRSACDLLGIQTWKAEKFCDWLLLDQDLDVEDPPD